MVDTRELRKAKIVFEISGKRVSVETFEKMEENSENIEEKYFFRGCKHTLEKHFSEAIKWFQLVQDHDATFMILLNAFKLGDSFLFSEYYKEDIKRGNLLKKTGLSVFLEIKGKMEPLSMDLIEKLKRYLEE